MLLHRPTRKAQQEPRTTGIKGSKVRWPKSAVGHPRGNAGTLMCVCVPMCVHVYECLCEHVHPYVSICIHVCVFACMHPHESSGRAALVHALMLGQMPGRMCLPEHGVHANACKADF